MCVKRSVTTVLEQKMKTIQISISRRLVTGNYLIGLL